MAAMRTTSSSPHAEFPPRLLWGLDSHFSSFNKMYVTDILTMAPHPSYPEAVAYGNHPMYKVDVMGIVVRKAERQKLFQYALDDGTGVVNCCVWKLRYTSRGPEARTKNMSGLGPELRSLLMSLRSEHDTEVMPYDLGDLLHLRGQVKVFRSNMEIVASYHRRVDNPNEQVTRMLELPALYQQCYDKPFQAPYLIEQEVTNKGQGGQSKPCLSGLGQRQAPFFQNCWRQKRELKVRICEVLSTLSSAEFSLQDLLMDPAVAALASGLDEKAAMRDTLQEMEEVEGTVCFRNQTALPYENLDRLCPLEGLVLSALRTLCRGPKYREKGCHLQQVLREVQRSVQYSSLSCAALQHTLNRLETNSDIIRISSYTYLPL